MSTLSFNISIAGRLYMIMPVQSTNAILGGLTIVCIVIYAMSKWNRRRRSTHYISLQKIKKFRFEQEKITKKKSPEKSLDTKRLSS